MKQPFLKSLIKINFFLKSLSKNKQKRGQGAIIAWVLLIGLSVSLAVIVSTWTREQAEETTETLVSQTEADLRCAAVSFNAKPECKIPYDKLKIVNRGDFTIHKFVIHIKPKEGQLISNTINLFEGGREPIKPGETKTLRTQDSFMNSEIELVPFIQVDGQYVGCTARTLKIKCV